LEQWRPPRVPRPKILNGRRERVWAENEIEAILGELFAPKREGERRPSADARYRVGRKVQFCLLNGLRHSEMNLIAKTSLAQPQLRYFVSSMINLEPTWSSHVPAT